MHSGFGELRNTYPTNVLAKYTGKVPISEKGKKEVERILSLWGESRAKTAQKLKELGEQDEGFLFGHFGIVDAFFWPILWVRITPFCSHKIFRIAGSVTDCTIAFPNLQCSADNCISRSTCLDEEDVE